MNYLVGTCGAHSGQEILIENEIVIGRDASLCQLVYPAQEKGVSGVHCKIQSVNGNIQLQDMGSTNGTYLDTGVRLSPYTPYTIEPGHGFYLGDRGNAYVIRQEGDGKKKRSSVNESSVNAEDTIANENSGSGKGGIGIAIAALVLGILAVILGIGSLFVDILTYPAIILGVIGTGLGAVSLAMHLKGKAMGITGTILSALVTVALVAIMITSALAPKTVVGSWTCPAVNEVKNTLTNSIARGLAEINMDERMAEALIEQSMLGNDLVFTFSDTGNVYLECEGGLNVELGIITWEDTQDGHIRIALDLKDVEVFGASMPIEIGYRAAYEIKGKKMTLDFFGTQIELIRKETEEE